MSIGSATLADNKQADCQQGYIKGIGRLNKRNFLFVAGGFALFTVLQLSSKQNRIAIKASPDIKKWHKDDKFWQEKLTPTQYAILRTGATEPRFSSQ